MYLTKRYRLFKILHLFAALHGINFYGALYEGLL